MKIHPKFIPILNGRKKHARVFIATGNLSNPKTKLIRIRGTGGCSIAPNLTIQNLTEAALILNKERVECKYFIIRPSDALTTEYCLNSMPPKGVFGPIVLQEVPTFWYDLRFEVLKEVQL